jgi:DNA-binding NtrC family response regulator
VPSLRNRKECILPLLHHYIDHFSEKLGRKDSLRFTRKASDVLLSYSYPGNVRELMNLCERLAVMCEGTRIDLADLPGSIAPAENQSLFHPETWKEKKNLREILESVEREVITQAMEIYGSQSKAAEVLGVNQSTIARKLKKYGLI